MTASAAGRGTFGFLCGLAEAVELPGPAVTRVLTAMGLSPAGARTHLSRLVRGGDLTATRTGRFTTYAMRGVYLEDFRTLSEWHRPAKPAWDGAFHLAVYEIDEVHRPARDALLRAARDDGFRALRPGTLVGAHAPGAWADAHGTLVGRWSVDDGTAREVIRRAWDTDALAERVRTLAGVDDAGWPTRSTPDDATRHGTLLDADAALVAAAAQNQAALFAALRQQPPFPRRLLPEDYPSDLLHDALVRAATEELPTASAAMRRLIAAADRRPR